jgi:hypothetical protein
VNPRKFLAELKRRDVYKVAVAYVAWNSLRADCAFRKLYEEM